MSTLAIFSKEARSALVAAEVHLSKDSLVDIFTLVLNALEPSNFKLEPGCQRTAEEADLEASSSILERFRASDLGVKIEVGGENETTGVVLVGRGIDDAAFVDFHTQLCDAAKADLTGFILEALQFHSTRAISVGEADIIATHVQSCKTLLGIPEEGE